MDERAPEHLLDTHTLEVDMSDIKVPAVKVVCIAHEGKCGKGGKAIFSVNGAAWHAANNGGKFAVKAVKAAKAAKVQRVEKRAERKAALALKGMAAAAAVSAEVLSESLGPVVNPDGTPTETTVALLTGKPTLGRALANGTRVKAAARKVA